MSKEKPVELPVGQYVIGSGLLSSMRETVKVSAGDMDPIEVKKGETVQLEWGMPYELSAEVTTNITGLNVDRITVRGSAKEAYITEGKEAPVVTVKFRGRPVRRDFLEIGPDGGFATWYWSPPEKGLYRISLNLRHKILGKLEVEEVELSYRPMGE